MHKIPSILSALVILSVFCLSSCRPDPNPSSGTSVSGNQIPQMVTTRLRANPDRLCPYQSSRAWTNTVLEHAFQKLLTRDGVTLELKPILAKDLPKVEMIQDGKHQGGYAISYEILEEASWDDGSPITGNDYLTTMKIVFNPAGSRLLPLYKDILKFYADIQVDEEDPKKFTVFTNGPNYKMVENTGGYILPAYAYDKQDILKNYAFADFADAEKSSSFKDDPSLISLDSLFSSSETTQTLSNIVGSGPYQFSEWNQNLDITLSKKENWWGAKVLERRPDFVHFPKSIRYEIIPDETAVIAKLKNGELDIATTISGTAFEELKSNSLVSEKYNFHNPATLSSNYIGINNRVQKLSDPNVRKAISCLVDRKNLIQEVYAGYAEPQYGPIHTSYPYAVQDAEYSFNPEKATSLLEEAGWKDTNGNGILDKQIDGQLEELKLTVLSTPTNTIVKQMLLIMQDDFRQAGLDIELVTMEANQVGQARRKGEFELMTSGAVLDGSIYNPYQYWHTSSPYNFFGSGNAEIDKLIDEIMETIDDKKRSDLFAEFQRKLHENQFLVFLNSPKQRMVSHKRLKNLKITVQRPNYLPNYAHL